MSFPYETTGENVKSQLTMSSDNIRNRLDLLTCPGKNRKQSVLSPLLAAGKRLERDAIIRHASPSMLKNYVAFVVCTVSALTHRRVVDRSSRDHTCWVYMR